MPLLAGLISSLITGVVAFLAKLFAAKLPIKVAAIAGLVAAGAALMVFFNTAISPLIGQAFNTQYGQFIGLAFPPVAGSCLATLLAAFLAIQTYKLQAKSIKLTANI